MNLNIKKYFSIFKNNLSFVSKNIVNSLLLSYLLLLLINKIFSDFASKIINIYIILWITAIFIVIGLILIKPNKKSSEIKKGDYLLMFFFSLLGSFIFYFNFPAIEIYSIILSFTVFIFIFLFSLYTVNKIDKNN